MLNQSFSPENFRWIFDYENRRGVYLEGKFFPDIAEVTESIKQCMATIRGLRKKKRVWLPEYYELQKSILNEEKINLFKKKEGLLTKELETISAEAGSSGYSITVRSVPIPGGKMAYATDNSPTSYFVIKQLQSNIRQLYKVKQSSRHEIICQLREMLGDPFPKLVIRTDIEDFYESIPQSQLLVKLEQDAMLASPSRRVLRQILAAYSDLTGKLTGIPRGIGISAYLSELYIRRFDEAIRAHDSVIYYARYVDDIVIIFSLRPNSSISRFLPFVKKQAAVLGLSLNKDKTSRHVLKNRRACLFEYLGYKIGFGDGPVVLNLSDKRKTKYKNRIKRSFDAYRKQSRFDEKRARRILIKRVAFLTGNTRLLNNKDNIMVGTYFSNCLLTNAKDFQSLDESLKARIRAIGPVSLRRVLGQYSFEQGFLQRQYHEFTTKELEYIVRLWKHEA
jgi:hypothetical protein